MKNNLFWLLLAIIVLFGFALRFKNLAVIPFPGQSQDEYSNTWVGLSLIEVGMPVGMSGVSGNSHRERIYINPDRIFQQTAAGDPMTIAYPWFDHPPLVGIITGSFAYLRGARLFEDVTAGVIRKPAIVFGAATIFLIGLTGFAWFGPSVGLLAALLYAISPLTTVMNRMVQAENFLTPLTLLSLYSFFRFSLKGNKGWLYLGSVSLMIAILMKLASIAFVLAGMILLKKTCKQNWPWIMLGASALAAVSWWAIFGMALSPDTFWSVLTGNMARSYGIGYQAVSDLITSTKVTGTKTLPDGWILAALISLFTFFVVKTKCRDWVLIPSLSYLAIYLLFGGESYGWYRIPIYPFAFISLAYFINRAINSAEIAITFLLLLPLGVSLAKLTIPDGTLLLLWRFLPILIVATGLSSQNKRMRQIAIVVILITSIVVSLYYNLRIGTDFWYKLG